MSLKKSQSEKPKEPLAMVSLDYIDEFWDHLAVNEAKSVFITATLSPPVHDPRPSSTGAFYIVMTALVEKGTAYLAQFWAPLENLSDVDDTVDSKGTEKKLWSRVDTFIEEAHTRGLKTHRGQWRRK